MSDKIKIKEGLNEFKSENLSADEKTVKRLEEKKIKPSIFIGSSTESYALAEFIQKQFNEKEFEVDAWKMAVFGQQDVEGNRLTNAENLKNFTDIYDFAIFLFTPDDQLISQTRKYVESGKEIETQSVRHNVIFEFGLFLGRIGAERSFILYDESVVEFVDLFFTDLKEDLIDEENDLVENMQKKRRFKIESYSFKSNFLDHIKKPTEIELKTEDLLEKVNTISEKMAFVSDSMSVGFLPSTSLAQGYFNNFLRRLFEVVPSLSHLVDKRQGGAYEKRDSVDLKPYLAAKKEVIFRIVIPDYLAATKYSSFSKVLSNSFFEYGHIPTEGGRPVTVYVDKSSLSDSSEALIIYDIPSTMNSSIEAIHMTTPHPDIRELLSEKERRNFEKVISKILESDSKVEIIQWQEFKEITGLHEL